MGFAGVLGLVLMLVAACRANRNDAFVGYSEGRLQHGRKHEPAFLFEQPEYLIFETEFGDIEVELASTAAPETVTFIKDHVARGTYNGCSFYRAEPPGDTYDQGSTIARKGYALVQGGLYSCGKQLEVDLPVESRWKHTKGVVSLITGTSEFFFSLEDHPEWDGSFSVWGKVASGSSFSLLEKIAALPTHQEVHPAGTVMRILTNEVKYYLTLRPQHMHEKKWGQDTAWE